MRHNDDCIITRTTTVTNPITHIAKPQIVTLQPFKCRLGRSSGTLVQQQPQGAFTQQQRIYVPNVSQDIKSGDIATIGTSKYIVGNVYRPYNHHIEADVVYKEEV